MQRSSRPAAAILAVLMLTGTALADGFHSPLLRNKDPRKWAQTIRERLRLDRSDSAEETRSERPVDPQMPGQLVNVLKYLDRKNVLLREFPDFNYDNIPAFKSETESILIAMGADAVPVLLGALVTDLKGAPSVPGLSRSANFIERVKHILVAIGDDAVAEIVRHLPDPDSRVRRALLDLLGRIVVDANFGSDVEAWGRWYSIWEAGRKRTLKQVPELVAALDESDHRMRIAAARSLGQIGSRLAVPALMSVIEGSGDRALVKETVRALARIGDLRATPPLIELLLSGISEVRQEAVTALRFLTHKMMGFNAVGPAEERAAAVARWRSWWEAQRR